MRTILNLIYLCTLPFWIFKAATTGKYREGLRRRFFGEAPATDPGANTVWLHAVSVGEVLLLRPLIFRLHAERPELTIAISTSTQTGYAVAKEKYHEFTVFYAPLDFTWAVRRVF